MLGFFAYALLDYSLLFLYVFLFITVFIYIAFVSLKETMSSLPLQLPFSPSPQSLSHRVSCRE